MPDNGRELLERAIGNIAILTEKSTTRKKEKLKSVKIGSDEAYYMLAAFCFDLSRKVNYLFRGTRDFASQADPELARQVIADNDAINADGLTWEQRARAAEAIMLRTVSELEEEHDRVLRAVALKPPRR